MRQNLIAFLFVVDIAVTAFYQPMHTAGFMSGFFTGLAALFVWAFLL